MIDKMREVIRQLVQDEVATIDTHALYEGTVIKQDSAGRLDVRLDDQRFGPGLSGLDIYTGVPGVSVTVPAGTRVAVGFSGGRRDKPHVRAFISGTPTTLTSDSTGTMKLGPGASLVELGSGSESVADPTGRVLRYGDTIQLPPPIGAPYVIVPGIPPANVAKVKA